ncbi:DUF257 family protein [Thermococcus sp.]|uniref:DUF257 family protein n=1 Tax=Thermococcus sp. TaxID=35749 RepID=UPI002607BE4A|nr:DUF257 family protein [Thermococcus sp.]
MDVYALCRYLLGKANRGDTVIVEYEPYYPVEDFSWGLLMPLLVETDSVVVADFFGVGNLLLRNYARRVSGKEYSRLIGLVKSIKVVKVGPGLASYGELLMDISPSYEPGSFLKNYHTIISRVSRLPTKPEYLVTFGLGHYVHFGGDNAVKSLLTGVSTIPLEDWVGIHFVNEAVVRREHLAILEEMASMVFRLSSDGITILKGGGAIDNGR